MEYEWKRYENPAQMDSVVEWGKWLAGLGDDYYAPGPGITSS